MGGRGRRSSSYSSSVATVVSTVDSSPSSAESCFRELDDVFLQTQTRIWLGEVLKIRLDEGMNISDMLADGELLFEVSKMVWNMLLEKSVELRQIKAYQSPLGSRKSSGRYKPYSNVDSFLKVCKILGLNGIDLFSPSDVVEKRDIRKVCICIRALSKKARSKQLNVPDFDLVTYTVVMPTDMVGCIRRSLESSQCSISSSSSCHSYKGTRSKRQQKTLIPSYSGHYDSCSEESDEAESAYCGRESYSLFTEKFDHPATLNSCKEDSPGAFSAVRPYTARQAASRSDMRNGLGIHCSSYNYRNGYQADNLHANNDLRLTYNNNASDLADIDYALGKDASNILDSLGENVAERDFIADYLAFSDSVVLQNDGNSPIFFDGEDNICNFFMSMDSHGLGSKQKVSQNGFSHRYSDDMEDVEVASMASMTSVLGRVLNLEFDDQYNYGDSSIVELNSIEFLGNETDDQGKGFHTEGQTQDSPPYDIMSDRSGTDIKESQSKMVLENEGFCTASLSTCAENGQPSARESEKFEVCGHSQIYLGSMHPASCAGLASAEDDEEDISSGDLKKAVMGMCELDPYLEQGKDQSPLETLHHNNFWEAKVSCCRCPMKGNEIHVCSMQYEDVIVRDITCQESQHLQKDSLCNHDFASPANECKSMASSSSKNSQDVNGAGHQASTGDNKTNQHLSGDGNEDGRNQSNLDICAANVLDEEEDAGGGLKEDRFLRGSLLKTFVKGTTLAGVLFLILHISRRGKEQANKPEKPPKTRQFGGAKHASLKAKFSRSNGTYPAEKLKFGN
ncbi:unnamed protein product [Coffea canephora]|uniref:Calponin-homology (CH) domain-containing protein n=1 Tax=Coffea canephora TaxID=49390 RepID=A0A068VBD1_COFCA|nr:unnamed protein product [Coffea canephora]